MVAPNLLSRRLGACILSLLLPLLAATVTASASIVDKGKVATVDGVPYYVGGIAVSKLTGFADLELAAAEGDVDVVPLTVIRTEEPLFTAKSLDETVANYTERDDVFSEGFLRAIYLAYDGDGQATLDYNWTGMASTLQKFDNMLFMTSPRYRAHAATAAAAGNGTHVIKTANLQTDLPKGPYFMSARTGDVFKAFRLYTDHQLAFTEAAISDEKDGFLPLPAVTEGAMTKSIAVPSRLYYTHTEEKPLAGLRMGVKDIFDLKGLKTSGGNRAYYDLYPPRNATGPAIQRLIDMGAVVVGKMGTVQFANGDNPTADWVDFHCPFNPRGDGYQAPGGSSSGPGAGIAAYDWLDIAVGSDTGGSMRSPSGMQGLFGNRPSTGAVPMDNVLPLCHALDTAGVFARSAATWARVVHSWYQGFDPNYTTYPRKLYYADDGSFPSVETEAGRLLEAMVRKIEAFLGVKRTPVDVVKRWEETHAEGTPADLREMLNTTYAFLVSIDQYRSLALPFFADYAARHDGRRPFINPGPLARWTWGQQHGGEPKFAEALRNKTLFKSWWEAEDGSGGYGRHNNETCSEGIYIYPYSTGKTQYRNEYFGPPTSPPLGFSNGRIAVYAEVPDLVVPVGEVAYNSTVSGTTEYMPVTLSIVAARGCDLMVANMVREMEEVGVLRAVRTGRRMYPDS